MAVATVALSISAAAANTIASDVFMFVSSQVSAHQLEREEILASPADSRSGICHNAEGVRFGDRFRRIDDAGKDA